jgi:aspartate/methionine/tyrosine aminotransferase
VSAINPLAIELNEVIREGAPAFYDVLSALGRELYYPKGILTQTAEAKQYAYKYNATIGIATEDGLPLFLPSIMDLLNGITPGEALPYAPTTGQPKLRELWAEHQLEVNPGMKNVERSLPIVTSGLTHGLSICADLFCDAGDILLLPDLLWGNYRMVYGVRRGAEIKQYRLFEDGRGMDIPSFRKALERYGDRRKLLVLLNYPNNPTGYTPRVDEAREIADSLIEAAEAGANVVAILDDAYFGLVYEDGIFAESLFGLIAGRHPRLAAIKLDGATKEDYVWGFRLGFITLSVTARANAQEVHQSLEKKVGGLIRGTISNSSMLAQSLLIRAMDSPDYRREKEQKCRLLRERYQEIKEVVNDPRYASAFVPYPFNSGYFMCVRVNDVDAEKVRLHLLKDYGVGVIAINENALRIAFSCLEREQVRDLFDILYEAVEDLRNDDQKGGDVR